MMALRKGDSVEVHSKQEGYVGSYYEATVVKPLEKNKYIVQYKTLVTDDEKYWLKEVVDATEVRPSPPKVKVSVSVSGFKQQDYVDAYDNEGWWVGRITGRTSPTHYSVYFDSTNEELSYPVSRIRVHQEWINGKWFTSQ
ncbi:agenet domain-containing protein [Thalictrum thalictroides]|uniref:Agenet domain-containing protein n=1 Tax=Thalictrum thalictroides TaxID=46969 RepID=A0A7J6VMY2_THATH|nr:agenet domain-containing protein [Thalictrum thalictroides]